MAQHADQTKEHTVSDDINERLAQLKKALDAGIIDEATYRFAVGDAKSSATVSGSGAIAQTGGVAAGAGGTAIGGDMYGNIYQGEPPQDHTEALRIYCEMFVKSHRHLPMRGVDVGASDPQQGQRQLDLDRVYVALKTKTMRHEEEELQARRRRTREDEEAPQPLSVLQVVSETMRCAVLGDPGSGKSSFVGFLGLCLALDHLEPEAGWRERLVDWSVKTSPVPILVVVRDFARWIPDASEQGDADALWQFLVSRLKAQRLDFAEKALEKALEDGDALVLIDGLDEIPTRAQRDFVRDAIAGFAKRYGNARMIATCRTLSYDESDWDYLQFTPHVLAPFDQEQIDRFVTAWYAELERIGVVKPDEAQRLTDRLHQAVRRPDLQRLASNPLLLTVMALVHTHKGRLPDARAVLYEETVDLLLRRWEVIKTGSGEDEQRLGQLLLDADRTMVDLRSVIARLAFEAHRDGGAGNDNAEDDGESVAGIGQLALIKALAELHPERSMDWALEIVNVMRLRAGLLVEREMESYSFPHRTFQEFLAGAHLAAQPDFAVQAASLTENVDLWRQVILLAVGRLVHFGDTGRPLALVGELCPNAQPADDDDWRKVWLAGEVLLDMGLNRVKDTALGRDLLEKVQGRLVDLLQASALVARERAEAGDVLAKLGDPRFRTDAWFLPNEPLLGFVVIPAGKFIMGSDPKKDKDADNDEQPQHTLDLPTYYIARYPVTVAQFRAYVEKTGQKPGSANVLRDPANRPVRYVTWDEAMAYCKWLTETLRDWDEAPEPLATWLRMGDEGGRLWHITLPSEAEWEKAARGGDGRINPWDGELTEEHANSRYSSIGTTSTVGCFPLGRSPYKLDDMCGNVWEWTRSLWGKDISKPEFGYPYDPVDGRENTGAGDRIRRVLRGGSFGDDEDLVRCAARNYGSPSSLDWDYGFRVIAAPIPLDSEASGL